MASRTYTAGDWIDQDVVFFGPLVGECETGVSVSYSDGRGVGAGTTVDLGDLDEDGRADLGFGSLHDSSDGGSAAELSIYLGLGD